MRIRVVGHRPLRVADSTGGGDAHVDTVSMWGAGGQTPVYDCQRLPGPALITEYSATTVVPEDFTVRIDDYYNLVPQRR